MIKLIQKISAVLLALVVLATTSGFHIYSHDCDCCGSEDISLIAIEECCIDTQKSNTCNLLHEQDASCCPVNETSDHNCQDADCCEVENHFVKLKNDFDKSRDLVLHFPNLENFLLQIIDAESIAEKSIHGFLEKSDKSPPKIPVRDFVIFCHSLKIAC